MEKLSEYRSVGAVTPQPDIQPDPADPDPTPAYQASREDSRCNMMTTEVGRFLLCACVTFSVLLTTCTAAPTARGELPEASLRLSEEDVGRVVSAMAREVLQIVNENVDKLAQPNEFGYGLDGLPQGPVYKRGKIACKTAWCMNNRLSHNLSSLDNPTDTGVGAPGRKRRDTS
ncbi:uncharacterized protein LOC118414606 [Branchiostoma floridae]|uniref:Uncharacterized protein LOC118414606 n=1 Tax=Branchiostoma floridae TaxID=7739 RepID=A0A9J7MNJ4_BRAFL|nr:uncharacterized protein LOC118414606 [Branchiostoma floridae]